MASFLAKFLKEAPGTRARLKQWMAVMLMIHALAVIFPQIYYHSGDAGNYVLPAILLLAAGSMLVKAAPLQVPLMWVLLLVAILLHVWAAIYTTINRADVIVMCAWTLAFFLAERRGYIAFAQLIYALVLSIFAFCISTFISHEVSGSIVPVFITLTAGFIMVVLNAFLLMLDFSSGKQQIDFFNRQFNKLDELSKSLSGILMEDKPLNEVLWNVTQECIPLLGLEDFVIYLYDAEKNKLVQVAAYGGKTSGQTIINPIEIPAGKGVVGTVYTTRKELLIADTTRYEEYIVDDSYRYSELAVPVIIGDEVFGVIDSEHTSKNFFTNYHLQLFNVIAAFCSIKIAKEKVRMEILEAEKNKLEALKMNELERLKSRFITNISHDLKTPLSLILGPATQIKSNTKDGFIKQQSEYILKNTEHLLNMVEQLLQLNNIEQGGEKIMQEQIDIEVLTERIYSQYVAFADDAGITFEYKVAEPIVITTDGFKLSQCIHNLLQNAFKHTSAGDSITILAYLQNEYVYIEVADTGHGIDATEHKRIFERFYKIDVNNHKGTGIGLSLIKEYAELLGGSVSVKSKLGAGAVFTICLPVAAVETMADVQQLPAMAEDITNEEKLPLVVIAEDHKELNDFVKLSLEQEGYLCLQAYNGKEALDIVREKVPDLIITDLMMPQLSGEELVYHIRSSDQTAHIPVIVLSAKGQVTNRVELYRIGADNYITKPFKVEELLAIANSIFVQRRKLRQMLYDRYMDGSDTEQKNVVSTGSDNQLIQQALTYILEHLDDAALNVSTLGKEFGLGRNRLQREIKTATGLTPVEFIRSVRLHEAYKMLKGYNRNITEVAYLTGFSNISYFSRSFKSQFGYTPSEVLNREDEVRDVT